ncbi:FAD-binding oxidoreductase [Aurantimonas sp. VKM B-3413]|uniref:NAD(P)/FAD-dependent oxidoreductase n=1 Tax=Aurantimonas sp. VKM B-3413 TaxID=2779401 RepID=UPI001E4A6EE5|nr:FAD-binding oxidoreductase [Aurantimonas sp. VKM B-3413]MCB8840358.1 FAD-binding oxidoreductase [Aurantimonas sp. VKM B-3413]
MQLKSYWHETAPRFCGGAQGPVEGRFDVAVVGGGFTGLSAARTLAKAGVRVALLEARHVGHGGSGRNGGHLNNGLAHSYLSAKQHLGEARAKALYRAFDDAVDTIERIVAEEGIDCSFRRAGKLKLASKPAHFDSIAKNFEAVHREVDPDTALLSKADLRAEIGSDAFHGAMLSKKSAMMHMGRFVHGMADAVKRKGGVIYEDAPVTARETDGSGWRLTTPRGSLTAERVFLATNAYTAGPFGHFRRRVIPVGSFVLATRPLGADAIAATMPGNRTCVTSLNVGNYFRLSPDDRLIFGGRARFSAVSDATSDEKSGRILRDSLARIFPRLAEVEIDYCWGGLVGMTKDRFPRAGEADGLYYAMGYSGHGAQLSTHIGEIMGEAMAGKGNRNPMEGMSWEAVPGHFGKPWFLPLVGLYYRVLDRIR